MGAAEIGNGARFDFIHHIGTMDVERLGADAEFGLTTYPELILHHTQHSLSVVGEVSYFLCPSPADHSQSK